MTFILNEDKALKTMLSGMTVSDEKNAARPVGVWFGQPDVEIRQQAYPYITIDLIDIQEALDRSMRGTPTLEDMGYVPEGFAAPANGSYKQLSQYPIPYNLDYQITTYARQPRHDRQILANLITNVLPSRYRSLYIPEDDTVRSMYVLQQMKRDRTEQDRRLFCNIFNVRVHSEIYLGPLTSVPQVASVVRKVQYATDNPLSSITP
jgi:hypothetical protein